jgi:hypothetical protein
VQIHVRAPAFRNSKAALFFPPLCLSSHRTSFVNSYSSVRVRPGAPFQWWSWCNSSTAPCDGVRIGANPFGHPNFARLPCELAPPKSGSWCNSSISAREADGPGANPGFLTKKENARRALKEIGLSASGSAQRAIPAPALRSHRRYLDPSCSSRRSFVSRRALKHNVKLFTSIHRFRWGRTLWTMAQKRDRLRM